MRLIPLMLTGASPRDSSETRMRPVSERAEEHQRLVGAQT